mmetsp:Transcript_34296/g.87260  ORF Transcript_34296/g.87260 Transcript_34296/m.87260 type:complete len:205 (+) Transcript_34296:374-988(+)
MGRIAPPPRPRLPRSARELRPAGCPCPWRLGKPRPAPRGSGPAARRRRAAAPPRGGPRPKAATSLSRNEPNRQWALPAAPRRRPRPGPGRRGGGRAARACGGRRRRTLRGRGPSTLSALLSPRRRARHPAAERQRQRQKWPQRERHPKPELAEVHGPRVSSSPKPGPEGHQTMWWSSTMWFSGCRGRQRLRKTRALLFPIRDCR